MILYVYLNCTAPTTNQPTLLYITIYLYYDTLLCYLLRSCLNFSYLFSLSHITLICGSIWDVLGSVLRSILGFILTLLGTSRRGPKTDSKSTPSQEGQNTVKRPREPQKPESAEAPIARESGAKGRKARVLSKTSYNVAFDVNLACLFCSSSNSPVYRCICPLVIENVMS